MFYRMLNPQVHDSACRHIVRAQQILADWLKHALNLRFLVLLEKPESVTLGLSSQVAAGGLR